MIAVIPHPDPAPKHHPHYLKRNPHAPTLQLHQAGVCVTVTIQGQAPYVVCLPTMVDGQA